MPSSGSFRKQERPASRANAARSERPRRSSAPGQRGFLRGFAAVAFFDCMDFRKTPIPRRLSECALAPDAEAHRARSFPPGHISSAIFAVLRQHHSSKPITSNPARLWRDGPQSLRTTRRECTVRCYHRGSGCAVSFIAAICLVGGKPSSMGLLRREPRPQTGSHTSLTLAPSRGASADESRDAILLDGSRWATMRVRLPQYSLFRIQLPVVNVRG